LRTPPMTPGALSSRRWLRCSTPTGDGSRRSTARSAAVGAGDRLHQGVVAQLRGARRTLHDSPRAPLKRSRSSPAERNETEWQRPRQLLGCRSGNHLARSRETDSPGELQLRDPRRPGALGLLQWRSGQNRHRGRSIPRRPPRSWGSAARSSGPGGPARQAPGLACVPVPLLPEGLQPGASRPQPPDPVSNRMRSKACPRQGNAD
jgi:hypothetical protein